MVSEIRARYERGESIHERHILLHANALRCAARKLFGSYRDALLASGLDPVAVSKTAYKRAVQERTKWTRDAIIDVLRTRVEANKPVHYNALVSAGFGSLCVAVPREFGDFKTAIEAAGLDYDLIRGDRQFIDWSSDPDLVLERIRALEAEGYELNYASVQSHDKSLCWAARKYFASWYGAVAKAGFDAEAVRRDRHSGADKGNIFENISFEIFLVLRPSWEKERSFTCSGYTANPDLYAPETEEWIDLKLRAHGESTDLSIQKYGGFAPSLRFIYLHGHRQSEAQISFQSIFDFEKEAAGTKVACLFQDLRELKSYRPPPIHLEKWAIRWTKRGIVRWIQKQQLPALSERNVLLQYNDLRCAARRLFGSWSVALEAAGIDPSTCRKQRPRIEKSELDEFIRSRWMKGKKLNPRYICDHYAGEYNASIRLYGGWRQAVTSNDIPYEKVIGRNTQQSHAEATSETAPSAASEASDS